MLRPVKLVLLQQLMGDGRFFYGLNLPRNSPSLSPLDHMEVSGFCELSTSLRVLPGKVLCKVLYFIQTPLLRT